MTRGRRENRALLSIARIERAMAAKKKSTSAKKKATSAKKAAKREKEGYREGESDRGGEEEYATKEQVAALFAVFLCCAQERVREAVGAGDWSGLMFHDPYPHEPMSKFLPQLASFLSEEMKHTLRQNFQSGSAGADAAAGIYKIIYPKIWPKPPCPLLYDTVAALMALIYRVDRKDF